MTGRNVRLPIQERRRDEGIHEGSITLVLLVPNSVKESARKGIPASSRMASSSVGFILLATELSLVKMEETVAEESASLLTLWNSFVSSHL